MAQDIKSIDDFLARTDFEVLKKAKKTLLKVISNLEGSKDEQEGEDAEDLESLLNFVDNFQDLAVDVYGIEEKTVFDLSDDDEEEYEQNHNDPNTD
jgi:hypothetical protein